MIGNRQKRMKIGIQRYYRSTMTTGEFQNSPVGVATHSHITDMNHIPATLLQYRRGRTGNPLIQEDSHHAASKGKTSSGRLQAANASA